MFWNKTKDQHREDGKLTTIEFANRNDGKKYVWVEPACVELELESHTEYQIITHETDFRVEFDNNRIVLYLQYSVGFILSSRPTSSEITNPNSWSLVVDYSGIG